MQRWYCVIAFVFGIKIIPTEGSQSNVSQIPSMEAMDRFTDQYGWITSLTNITTDNPLFMDTLLRNETNTPEDPATTPADADESVVHNVSFEIMDKKGE